MKMLSFFFLLQKNELKRKGECQFSSTLSSRSLWSTKEKNAPGTMNVSAFFGKMEVLISEKDHLEVMAKIGW